ncbi:MAG: hypothetical protein GY797_18050 [Deltaproteobacteria bacterium]|nr:hypothetical protein [Deltaproteobacteria bacterium]
MGKDTADDKDLIAYEAIKNFVGQIPGNRDMPLEQDVNNVGFCHKLGPVEDLPQAVQNIVGQIKSAGSAEEKAAIAHSFSNSYIRSVEQIRNDRAVSFDELAKDPVGDCDDYARFNAGLLLYGDVDPEKIFILAGMVKYEINGQSVKSGHAFVVLKNEEKYHLLDNNLAGIPLIDPENPVIKGTVADVRGEIPVSKSHLLETNAEILYIANAKDGRGVNFENDDATTLLTNYMMNTMKTEQRMDSPDTVLVAPDRSENSSSEAAHVSPDRLQRFSSEVAHIAQDRSEHFPSGAVYIAPDRPKHSPCAEAHKVSGRTISESTNVPSFVMPKSPFSGA